MARYILVFLLAAALTGSLSALHFARWSTNMGTFVAELYDDEVPITANNFISLANSGFYNDLIFHRVVEGFVIQDGCPYGTGYGGPGYTIPDEFYPGFHHDQAGILAMARTSAPNSAGSQYYITLAPASHLDGNYAIFGKVVLGLDVVLNIGSVPVDANDHPVNPVTIDTLRILDLAIGNITPSDDEPYVCDAGFPQMFIVEASADVLLVNYAWFVDGVEQQGSLDFIFETAFSSPGAHEVTCRVSNSDWTHEISWEVDVQGSAIQDPDAGIVMPSLAIHPNPTGGGTSVIFKASVQEPGRIEVYDLRGRLVRNEILDPGRDLWFWDAKDELGFRVPPGVYLIKASRGGKTARKRCLVY